jgi:hypothetical protein
VFTDLRPHFEQTPQADLLLVEQKQEQKFFYFVLDQVVYERRRWHPDNLASDEFVFDAISAFVELVRQSEVLLGGQERRGGHTAILAPSRGYTPQQ